MNTASANDQFRQKAHEIKDNIVDMAGIAKDAAQEKLSNLRDAAGARLSNLKDGVQEKYSDLKEGAASRYHAGVDKAAQARDSVTEYVKDNPGKSILACLAVGALAGFLVSRRR